MSKLIFAAVAGGFAFFVSFAPAMAEGACSTKGSHFKEAKQLDNVIKKSKQFIEIAAQLENQEVSEQIIEDLKQDIAKSQSRLQKICFNQPVDRNIDNPS